MSFSTIIRRDAIFKRIIGTITFKDSTYRTIAKDETATRQAAILVIIVALIQWLCSNLAAALANSEGVRFGQAILSTSVAIILGLIVWGITGWLLAFIANRFGGQASAGEMLRVAGFIQVFGLLSVFGLATLVIQPFALINLLIAVAILVLTSVGYYISSREVANLSSEKAFLTTVTVSIIVLIVLFLLDRIGNAVLPDLLGRVDYMLRTIWI